jgi:transglutaminase-like putative cysteine protease
MPMPVYSRIADFSSPAGGRVVPGQGGLSVLLADAEAEVEYAIVLDRAPDFAALTGTRPVAAPADLLRQTVPDDELPPEVHAAVEGILQGSATMLDRALAVRDFIRDHYYYDRRYIEDPDVGRWLATISRGRGNAHIAAMHAGRDADHLGRGVCYELNNLACELLRRVEIPAAIATGWTFDRGHLDEPDHLWALALLPTGDGPRWLPLDASTTRKGQPLHAGRRPPGPWRARTQATSGRRPATPAWAQAGARRHEDGASIPVSDLMRVIGHLETLAGRPASDRGALRERCRTLLADPAAAAAILRCLGERDD